MRCTRVCAQLGEYIEGDLDLDRRTRIDTHLAACASCASELRALRSTISLLRAMPTPEVPEDLTPRIMARIRARETNPDRLPRTIRWLFDARVAAPLAAGITALVVFATLEGGVIDEPAAPAPPPALAATNSGEGLSEEARMWNRQPATLAGQNPGALSMPRLLAIERSAGDRFFWPTRSQAVGFIGRTDPDPQQLDLDEQLDMALRDPMGFLHRVSEMEQVRRGTAVAPLAWRAGRRGDAATLAVRLRSTPHPLARSMADHFERRSERYERRPPARLRSPIAVPASHQ